MSDCKCYVEHMRATAPWTCQCPCHNTILELELEPSPEFDKWYESYPDTTPYMEGMRDAFNAGMAAASPRGSEALTEQQVRDACESAGYPNFPGWCFVLTAKLNAALEAKE